MTSQNAKKSGEKVRARKSGNRERIIAVALHLFTTQGFHATPIAQILKEADLSTGTFFYYFPDKNTLIDQVYLSIKKEGGETIRAIDDPDLPANERLERLVRAYVAWGVANPEKYRFMEQFSNSPNIGEQVKHEGYREFARLHEIIETAIKDGVLPDKPYAYYSVMIGQVLSGILILIGRGNTNMTQEEIIENGLNMLLKR